MRIFGSRWIAASVLAVAVFAALLLVLAYLLLPTPLGRWDGEEARTLRQLEWVKSRNPTASAMEDAELAKFRFYGICGITCITPSVDIETVETCYPSARIEIIPGTGDVIFSDEHASLRARAIEFAEQYNSIMVDLLKSKGASLC